MRHGETRSLSERIGIALLLIVILPMLIPVVLVFLLFQALLGAVLYLAIWTWWCPRGKSVLLVYSDSPIWRDYFDAKVLPRLGERAVVLNWSERKRWPFTSLAVTAFRHFGGYREFNPLAVVFRPFRRRRIYRFWQPFREYKYGKPEAVETMTENLFALLDGRAEKVLV